MTSNPRTRGEPQMFALNRRFYDALWSRARLVEPQRFNTWPLVQPLAQAAPRRLEVAAGLRPRLPLEGTQFVDISRPALAVLQARAAGATLGSITVLPYADDAFELVCALDVIEHVEDGDAALSELARVAADGATLLLSVPLYMAYWTPFDDIVGHRRRYEPVALQARLAALGLSIERSAVFGMRPRKSWLYDLGMWFLAHQRDRAMWWYNHVFMPLGVRLQKPLALHDGMVSTEGVDEVLLVCRKRGGLRRNLQ